MAGGARCPSEFHPRYCALAARGGPWPGKIRARAEDLAGRPAPTMPPGFPRMGAPGKVRVGLITPVLYQAGAEHQTLAIARHVDPSRVHWAGLAVLSGAGSRDPGMTARFEELMPVADGRDAARALARAVDLLVAWDARELGGLLGGVPLLSVVHSPPESDWGNQSLALARGVTRFVAVSELALAAIPGDRRGDSPTIWNCVDPSRLVATRPRAEMLASWGVPPGARVLGHYGRMSPEKRPEDLARALGSLPGDWHGVVVGGGWTRDRVEAVAAEGGVAGRLHFPGQDPRAGDVLGAFDVLAVLSEFESFGLTLGEGLWMGTPVVSRRVGIARLQPGLTREVPPDADGPTLARAVLAAHANGPMPGATRWARERLAPARFGREWTGLILETARRPAPTPAPAPAPGPAVDPAVRDAVLACPHRGPEGGLALLDEERSCCGGGQERTACALGKGRRPGRVTLRECLACGGG